MAVTLKKHLHFDTHMGRMGNQMFQYACAKEMQHAYGFSCSVSHLDKLACFELGFAERFTNRVKSFLFFRLWKKMWGMQVLNTDLNCLHRSYLAELKALNKPTTIWGFFQSPEYFRHTEKRIRRLFQIKAAYKQPFHEFLREHNLKEGAYIAVHVRRTDYKGFRVPGLEGDDFTLPESYYHNALASLQPASQGMPVIFVSDDPKGVQSSFEEIDGKIISENDAITDFQILSNAAHLIISNSTYAWWAAWLNPHVRQVICPKYFLGFKEAKEVPFNIYPQNWQQVKVF